MMGLARLEASSYTVSRAAVHGPLGSGSRMGVAVSRPLPAKGPRHWARLAGTPTLASKAAAPAQ